MAGRKAVLDNLEDDVVLWRDRKRILGMPISFTVYEMTDDRLITRKGLFRTETDEVLLYRVLDIKLVRTFGQKLTGVGTITVFSADQSHATQLIKSIARSEKVRKLISTQVEKERKEKSLTGREIYGSAGIMAENNNLDGMDFDGDGLPD